MSKNTKILLIALVSFVVAGVVIFVFYNLTTEDPGEETQTEDIKDEEWETYRNEEYGFKINYPENFELVEKEDPLFFVSLDIEGDVLASVSVGHDQVGYDLRLSGLESQDNIEDLELEEDVINADKSFTARYVRTTKNMDGTTERTLVTELYAFTESDNIAYMINCSGDHDRCGEMVSTFDISM